MTHRVDSDVPGPRGLGLVLVRVVVAVFAFGVFALCCASAAFATGDASEQVCPNETLEGFRAVLPDCRAYEMVTPPYKEGYGFFVSGYSSDGDKMFLSSLGTVGGAVGGGEGVESKTTYIDVRTPSGWRLSPVNPSLNDYVGQSLVTAEADSGASLWVQHTPAQSAMTQDLYVRSPTGEYSLVGPLNTPALSAGEPSDVMELFERAEVLAATSDYSHIVFLANQTDRWTFDSTQGGDYSLYEYNGLGNAQPTLVAVLGGKGSTQLVGQCGAQLGGQGSQRSVFNAISSNGETVFFTPAPAGTGNCKAPAPGVAEVWARLHGGDHVSQGAESVDISENRCSEACSPLVSGSNFEGASENGEIAFFTSTQKLTNGASQDPDAEDNASSEFGGCAETAGEFGCNLYMYDFNAAPGSNLRLVAGHAEVLGVAGIAENGSRIYFVARGGLTGGATPGAANLYVYDTKSGTTTFIATLNSELDTSDWRKVYRRPVEVTPDGRFVVFASSEPGLTPDDTATTEQLFEYDAETGELVRISQGENGYDENGNGASESVAAGYFAEANAVIGGSHDYKIAANRANIADDGMTVVFVTRGQLSPLAVSAEKRCTSVYEYRSRGTIAEGAVHLISDGLDVEPNKGAKCGATFFGTDANGRNILFSTDDPLLPGDTDGVQRDVYDAREAGGFAASPVTPAPTCLPGGCGAPTGAGRPVSSTPVSATQAAEGNETGTVTRSAKGSRKAGRGAGRLARALRVCRSTRSRHRRVSCEASARRRYGARTGNRRRGA